jgi:pimeloyl-ACP methyl ester carboxylesterase
MYLRAPRLLSPLFCANSLRIYPEIAAANGGIMQGLLPAIRHGWNVLTHPFSPARMARRVKWLADAGLERRICRIQVPTLILTGDGSLDRVVPVHRTGEYANICSPVERAVIPRTGHIGLITRPDVFADLVSAFARNHHLDAPRRHVG